VTVPEGVADAGSGGAPDDDHGQERASRVSAVVSPRGEAVVRERTPDASRSPEEVSPPLAPARRPPESLLEVADPWAD
jgi:hypothetical protein